MSLLDNAEIKKLIINLDNGIMCFTYGVIIMKDENKKSLGFILLKPAVKAALLSIFTILIGILTSIITNWYNDYFHIIILIISIIICLLYILIMIFYAKEETNLHKAYGELKNQNEAYAQIMLNFATTFKVNSKEINTVARYYNGVEGCNQLEWHFDTICQALCGKVYEIVCKVAEHGDCFTVSYIKRMNDSKNVKMVAYNVQSMQPHIYDQERSIAEDNPFLDIQLFKKSNPAPTICATPDDIISAGFKYKCEADRKRYKQYIGVPVFCTGTYMDGLLQVIVESDSILKSEERDLVYFVEKILIPYEYLFLLFRKIDKVIVSKNRFMEDKDE